jgi:eukaryotic-like serine/threonine-protein kinase
MGTVYLGHDTSLDRPVALKFISARSPDRKSRDRFLVEARAIARLQHPNVVGIYRIGEVDGNPYIAYELVAGLALHELARPLPWRQALAIAVSVSRGLAAAHRRGVLHRDIKPANIMLAQAGDAKLLDFGLAKLDPEASGPAAALPVDGARPSLDPPPSPSADTDPWLTRPRMTSAGKLAGTPAYMAPELWHGEAATTRSDLYAFGLVLYELLVGLLPWSSSQDASHIDVPPIGEKRPDLPRPLADAIDRLTRRDPRDRFASAEEVRDAFETVASVYGSFTEHDVAPMADEEAASIAASFGRVAPNTDPFAGSFYERLFTLRPDLRPLFPADMSKLRHKLVNALQLVVRNLRTPELIVPMLDDLGARHAHYGAVTAHFETLGQALLGTLAEHDRASWTPELEAAWRHAFDRLSATMVRGLERELAAGSSRGTAAPHPGHYPAWTAFAAPPRTQYARNGDHAIAYQVVGAGPLDLVVLPGWVSHLEQSWQEPSYARFLRRFASRARVIVIDKRGTGLSDRSGGESTIGDRVHDLIAVMDEARVDRAAILGISDSAALAAYIGATVPDRVRALILYGGAARMLAAPDYPEGLPPETLEGALQAIREHWGEPLFLDREAPSRAGDDHFRAWWATYLRAAASPAAAVSLLRESSGFDVRAALPAISAPTLVMHRLGDRMMPLASSRHLAASIHNARLLELPGEDHLPFTGDADRLVDEVFRFLLDLPTDPGAPT